MRHEISNEGNKREFLLLQQEIRINTDENQIVACDFIKNIVSCAFDVPIHEMNSKTRQQAGIAFARQVAMYIAHVRLGISLGDVGRTFQRDRTTVGHACRLVEDKRDDEEIDFLINCLERALDEWLKISSHAQFSFNMDELQ